jgi:dipeptidyl aminopeptidase/acylaminoacyl peptidase
MVLSIMGLIAVGFLARPLANATAAAPDAAAVTAGDNIGGSFAPLDEAALPAPPQQQQDQQATQERGQGGRRGQATRGGRRGGGRRGGGGLRGIYRTSVAPNWFADNTKFWYRNELRNNTREFILVDAEKGERNPAFDHARLAASLAKVVETTYTLTGQNLPFQAIEPSADLKSVNFSFDGKTYKCDLTSYEVTVQPPGTAAIQEDPTIVVADSTEQEPDLAYMIAMEDINQTSDGGVDMQTWMDQALASPSPQAAQTQQDGARGARGERGARGDAGARGGRGGRGGGGRGGYAPAPTEETPLASPDGKWVAFGRDFNVFVRNAASGTVTQLSTDGVEGDAYRRFEWAPDSQALLAWRLSPGVPNPVYTVDSMPDEAGPAQLRQRNYTQPGNKMDEAELNVFTMADFKQIKPLNEENGQNRWDFRPGPSLRWNADQFTFTVIKNDRGHQRWRLIEVNTHAGEARNIIDEDVRGKNSFIWTDHTQNIGVSKVTWLDGANELVLDSEAIDGWRHLYLLDAQSGRVKNTITPGNYVVRGVQDLDEANRVVWFSACGVYPDQDPYFIHYGRVNFDGTGLTWLTESNGTHSIEYSPDRKYIVDNYSRLDLPPATELRRVSDGKLVTKLEDADYSELVENGTWNPPTVFVAKGRDGVTDIWGYLAFPRNVDPTQKYPLIEPGIYAGPHGSHAPHNWGGERQANWTAMGTVAVQLDGMGTANRSKAFHDVCWRNVHDGGFPDRILWMKAAAQKYPFIDTTRVAVYGTSAGGQNTLAALLFFGDFYTVGVANCGCHDNRIDKESWNEQWMGYRPDVWSDDPDNWFATNSNVDNAYRLTGRLQLVVGELDTNVPPESTFRVVDRLIAAQREFELVVVPGADHGAGSQITGRKRDDFIRKHLLGIEPPNHNEQPPGARGGRGGRAGGRGGADSGAGAARGGRRGGN